MKKSNKKLLSILSIPFVILPPALVFASAKCKPDKNPPTKFDEQKIKKEMGSAFYKVELEVKDKNKEAKDVKDSDIIISKYDTSIYEIAIKSKKVDSIDETILKIELEIKHKESKIVYSKTRVFTVSGFKPKEITDPNEKAFHDFVSTLKQKYDGDLTKLDANEIELGKITIIDKDGGALSNEYKISNLAFENETAKEEDYNKGKRSIIFDIDKDKFTKKIRLILECHKSNFNAIINQRESSKTGWTFVNDQKALDAIQKLELNASLFWDFKEKAIFDKVFTDNTRVKLFTHDTDFAYGTKFHEHKLIKKDGELQFSFILGFYNKNKQTSVVTDIKDLKTITVNPIKINEIVTKEKLNNYADSIKNQFKYKDVAQVELKDAKKEDVILPENPTYEIEIKKVEPQLGEGKLIVSYICKSDTLASDVYKAEITGFKSNALTDEFTKFEVKYKGDITSVLASSITDEKNFLLVKKGEGSDYDFPSDIQATKKIVENSANDIIGSISIEVTLTKGSDIVKQVYVVKGFKTTTANVDELAKKVTISLKNEEELKKSLASSVKETDVEFAGLSEDEQKLVEIKVKELKANDPEGKLTIIATVTLNSDSTIKEITKEFEGFKQDSAVVPANIKSEELWKASRAGNLLKVTGTQEELKKEIEEFLASSNKNKILASNGDGLLKKGKKAGQIFQGVTITEEYKSFVYSHGGDATFGSYEGTYNSNTKGFTIIKENNKYYFGWRCLGNDNKPIEEAKFKFEICNA